MKKFVHKHADKIFGVISGFDRLIFRGGIRSLMYEAGMASYLNYKSILLKDFKDHAISVSTNLKEQTKEYAKKQERPFIYLPGNTKYKEEKAREMARKEHIKAGLVCIFSILENCNSYKVIGNRSSQRLEIKRYPTKCLHFYHYWIDPIFGLMHGRIQSWYPFNIQFYINGREWLGNLMRNSELSFNQVDNCFNWVSDLNKVSTLTTSQLSEKWPKTLDQFATTINPLCQQHGSGNRYYWTTHQSEWATDIIFKNTSALDEIYPELVTHSMLTFNSKDIIRFLGKRINCNGSVPGNFNNEVISNFKERPEGVRVKHSIGSNSVKFYNKAGSVLRVETTINQPKDFKVFRPVGDTDEFKWQPMRKSVVDISRRAQISRGVNERQLDALANACTEEKFSKIINPFLAPIKNNGVRTRGIDPLYKDFTILNALGNGYQNINGFRNRDLRKALFSNLKNKEEIKKHSAKISRHLRLLRSHGIIKKVPRTHRYHLTGKGTELITVLKAMNKARVSDILKAAA